MASPLKREKASSSNGRAPDSKSGGWGFKSLLACHVKAVERSELCRLGVPRILGWCSGVNFSEISLPRLVRPERRSHSPAASENGPWEGDHHMITMTERWQQLVRFLRDIRIEVKKVNWPPRKEVVGSTIVVIVSVFIVSFFLGIVDVTLQKLIAYVLK